MGPLDSLETLNPQLMKYRKFAKSYKTVSIETASPGKIILMLFDGALRHINTAIEGFKLEKVSTRNEEISNNIVKAQNIIMELQNSLNLDVDGEFPMTMYRLYDFMFTKLSEANLKKNPEQLRVVEEFLLDIRNSWSEMLAKSEQPAVARSLSSTA